MKSIVVYADAIMQENWQLFTKKLSDVFYGSCR